MKKKSETIMDKKREEMREEFLKLTPLQRICRMSDVFNDIIAFKAKTKGVPEYEIYQSYLIHRDKKLEKLLKSRGKSLEPEDKELLI